MSDKQTLDYFDNFTPHFKPERFEFALEYLNNVATDKQRILDIGCGDGGTLYLIMKNTPLKTLFGLDISKNYLKKARGLVGCDTIQGSILDRNSCDQYWGTFDYCVLGAVIHHLIGKNRKESFQYAKLCLENAIGLLKPGGSLLIFEPTHSPSVIMDLVFWIKKTVGNLTNKRIEISTKWANIGQPVVSYYTRKQLLSFIECVPNIEIVLNRIMDDSRLGIIIHRIGMGIIVRKSS